MSTITETIGGLTITRFPDAPPPTPQEMAQQQIDALENEYLMPRVTRESLIAMAEERALALGLTIEQLRIKNKGYEGLKALDEQIAALRIQL
jgi:thiamine monophosphate synthase